MSNASIHFCFIMVILGPSFANPVKLKLNFRLTHKNSWGFFYTLKGLFLTVSSLGLNLLPVSPVAPKSSIAKDVIIAEVRHKNIGVKK